MDFSSILTKTSVGHEEVAKKSGLLTHNERRILILADGKRSIGDLDKFVRPGELTPIIEALMRGRFVREADPAAPPDMLAPDLVLPGMVSPAPAPAEPLPAEPVPQAPAAQPAAPVTLQPPATPAPVAQPAAPAAAPVPAAASAAPRVVAAPVPAPTLVPTPAAAAAPTVAAPPLPVAAAPAPAAAAEEERAEEEADELPAAVTTQDLPMAGLTHEIQRLEVVVSQSESTWTEPPAYVGSFAQFKEAAAEELLQRCGFFAEVLAARIMTCSTPKALRALLRDIEFDIEEHLGTEAALEFVKRVGTKAVELS